MTCVICAGSMEHKRPQAKYCSTHCKYKANINLDSIKRYVNSTHGRAHHLLHASRTRDKNNTLTLDWVKAQLDRGTCAVTGIAFEYAHREGRTPFTPSLDKIDPHLGYTPENTRAVVWIYNSAKNVFTDSDVLKMAKALVKIGEPLP